MTRALENNGKCRAVEKEFGVKREESRKKSRYIRQGNEWRITASRTIKKSRTNSEKK